MIVFVFCTALAGIGMLVLWLRGDLSSNGTPPFANLQAWADGLLNPQTRPSGGGKPAGDWPLWLGRLHPAWVAQKKAGEGGVGIVFMVWDGKAMRWMAVKVLKMHYGQNMGMRHRFMDEAALLRRCSEAGCSPAICAVSGSDAAQPWFAMEWLGAHLPLLKWMEPRVPFAYRYAIARQIVSAVAAMHSAGVVHRDLCPMNLMVACYPSAPPDVKIIDFGSATVVDRDIGGAKLLHQETQVGWFAGKYAYADPDMVRMGMRGANQGVDVFTLGVILFELLTHRQLPTDARGCIRPDAWPEEDIRHMIQQTGSAISFRQADGIVRAITRKGTDRPTARELEAVFR